MDAAKAMRLFYENPDMSFEDAYSKFLDIRKRTVRFPKYNAIQLVCIPTTSGTGSEVSPFSIIKDAKTGIKHTLCDYSLNPDVAIVDDQFVETMPKELIARSGFEALAHAVESYVSTMATDFTRGWSMEAIKLIFENLEKSYNGDQNARSRMHNAATLAGMAYANAFLGVGHAIAHTESSEFGIPSGLSDAIAMPYVIRFNSKKPRKLAMRPHYSTFRADKDYAEIARSLGLKGNSDQELIDALIKKVVELGHAVGMKLSLKANGISETDFNNKVENMAVEAYGDQNVVTNPSALLISEIKNLMKETYTGKGIEA